MNRFPVAVVVLLLALATTACTGPDGDEARVRVFAAASLTDALREIGEAFEEANPGTDVQFNFASSSALALQITQGAPADVFASANEAQMDVVLEEGMAETASTFAMNELAIVVARGSDVASFGDLAAPGLRLVLAAPEVPAGAFAREVLANADEAGDWGSDFSSKVMDNVVSNETDVRSVLTKVQLGEADAGIVYQTDAAVAGDEVTGVEVPANVNVRASYPIAVLNEASNKDGAQAFVEYLLSAQGQEQLRAHGFGRP